MRTRRRDYILGMKLSAALVTVAVLSFPAAASAATAAVSGSYTIVSATAVSTLTWQDYEGSDETIWSGFERGTLTLAKPSKARAVGGSLDLTVPLKGNVDASYTFTSLDSTRTCPQSYNAAQLGVNVGLTVMPVGAHKVRVGGGPDISANKVSEVQRLVAVCDSQFVTSLWHFSDYGANGYGWDDKTFPAALFKKKRFTITLQGQRTIGGPIWSLDPGTATRAWKLQLTLQRS